VAARRSVQENPGLVASQRQLVVNHALIGEIDEARAALIRVKQLVPNVSLQTIARSLPNIRDAEQSKIFEAFPSLRLECKEDVNPFTPPRDASGPSRGGVFVFERATPVLWMNVRAPPDRTLAARP
jgi:hypothetical protein